MAQMVYYYLVKGDYLQLGDEYEAKASWKSIANEWIGVKFGYDPKTGLPHAWPRVRRLAPESLGKPKVSVPFQEQYGEEFEIY